MGKQGSPTDQAVLPEAPTESESVEGAPTTESAELAQLQSQLAAAQQLASQKEEAYRRALADYQNLQRQTGQEKQRLVQLAEMTLLLDLLPTLDHLEMAITHGVDPAVQMVRDQLFRTLEQHGLTRIPAEVGQEFDPELMEVIDTTDGPPNQVVTIARQGYQLKGTVVRHVQVIVGKAKKRK